MVPKSTYKVVGPDNDWAQACGGPQGLSTMIGVPQMIDHKEGLNIRLCFQEGIGHMVVGDIKDWTQWYGAAPRIEHKVVGPMKDWP